MEPYNTSRQYEWLIIAQSYFQCALMSARILSKQLSDFAVVEGSPLEYCLKEIYGDYLQEPAYLVFPIIFDFRHGIELYLKAIIGMTNSEFPRNHNSCELLIKAKINNEKITDIIKKYLFGNLLLVDNTKCDTKNEFERYPQGSPYDNLDLFPTINKRGKTLKIPDKLSLDGYLDFLTKNDAEVTSVINQEKVNELISDIELLYKEIRNTVLAYYKTKINV